MRVSSCLLKIYPEFTIILGLAAILGLAVRSLLTSIVLVSVSPLVSVVLSPKLLNFSK